ncbi:MAG: prolyl oligopeptidase family serine peptidase [Hyphomonadaceae bacterium]|nr:prolyl oligopeptidase family serine peptidase [Hyphomonadaceae bacterium]
MFRVLLVGLCLAVFPGFQAQAQAPQPPLEAYGSLPFVSDADLSPDGQSVAVILNMNGGKYLLVQAIGGEQRLALNISEHKARSVSFFGNDNLILRSSITTRANYSRYDYEYSGAISIEIKSGDFQQLFYRTRDLHPRQGGLGRMVGRNVEEELAYMPGYTGNTNTPSYDLYSNRINRSTGRRVERGTQHTIDWFVGPDGEAIAREDFNGRDETYRIYGYVDDRELIYEEESPTIPISLVGLTETLDGLYFVATGSEEGAYSSLYRLGFDGAITETDFGRPDADIANVYMDDSRAFQGVRYSGSLPSYRFVDQTLQTNVDSMIEAFPDGMVSILTWSHDASRILFRGFDGQDVDRYFIYDASAGSFMSIAASRQNIPPQAVASVVAVEYAARDGLTIPAIATFPLTQAPGPYPTIIMPHGGPASYDRIDFDWMAQYFANRGYLVLQPNFRGSSGFGDAFQTAGDGEWGRAMQDDITDGLDYLIAEGVTDPERVCIVGASYGGYAALAGGAFTPDKYACVVAIAGVSDLDEMLDQVRRESGRRRGRLAYWEQSIAAGDTDNDRLDAVSPVKYAENFQAPVLLIHGKDDTVVPIRQSTLMNSALRRADKQVEFIKLDGEDHWLSTGETRLATLRAMDEFVSRHAPVAAASIGNENP